MPARGRRYGEARRADESLAGAAIAFWGALRPHVPFLSAEPVTEEAFTTARTKLPIAFFRRLFQTLVARFEAHFATAFRWHGFRLLGLDGTPLTLPACPTLRRLSPTLANQHASSNHRRPSVQPFIDLCVANVTGRCHRRPPPP